MLYCGVCSLFFVWNVLCKIDKSIIRKKKIFKFKSSTHIKCFISLYWFKNLFITETLMIKRDKKSYIWNELHSILNRKIKHSPTARRSPAIKMIVILGISFVYKTHFSKKMQLKSMQLLFDMRILNFILIVGLVFLC